MKILILRIGAALVGLFCSTAVGMAQATAEPTLPTNVPNVGTHVAPPPSMNPLTASAQELTAYGYPPNPGVGSAAYAGWAKAVSAPQIRLQNPKIEVTNIQAGPARDVQISSKGSAGEFGSNPQASITSTTTQNWSGWVIDDVFNRPFGGNNGLAYIYAYWVVPVAQQAFSRVGDGTWDDAVEWVGLDGFNGNDVLQGGTETDTFADAAGDKSAFYAAWFEWFPLPLMRISNFPIAPGDEIFTEVWNSSPTLGHVYIVNFTQNRSVIVTFTAPQGTQLNGNSAEWIVERFTVNGQFANLMNYVACPFDQAVAVGSTGGHTYNQVYYPGVPFQPVFDVTMLDNSNNPISSAALQGQYDLWFRNTGSSH